MYVYILLLLFVFGCSSSDGSPGDTPSNTDTSTDPPARPGLRDSSKVFLGTLSPAETAYWTAVRTGDDAGRANAVADLKSDIAQDPKNGYSAFLAASSSYFAGVDTVSALAAGEPSHGLEPFPTDTAPLLKQALGNLKDPFYVGFASILLAGIQVRSDYIAAGQSQQVATSNNFSASSVGRTFVALAMNDTKGALDIMFTWLKYCNSGNLDRNHPDIDAFVATGNAGGFVQRECYSGPLGLHGTEGELLITGDLFAVAGNTDVANLYYNGLRSALNYEDWPLRPLVERRIDNSQPATAADLSAVVACTTCHTHQIP